MDASYYMDLLRPIYQRRWIIAVDFLAGATPMVKWFRTTGVPRPFVLAGSHGTGELPHPDDAEWAVLHTGGGGVMESTRAFAAALADLPSEVVSRIDQWDPDRSAGVLGGYLASHKHVAGRPMYGARPPEWESVEDKTTVNELWMACDIDAAPFELVRSNLGHLSQAAARLDRGDGTVWVADNKEGIHGGAEYLRWVTNDEDAVSGAAFLEAHSDTARVMAFIEGIPCSIHGVVFDDAVIAFRPVEAITLREGRRRLRYCGTSSFWDAPEPDVVDMQASAKRLGAHLCDLVDYRGIFTMDGVLGVDGFVPTELNPRPGAGIGPAIAGAGDLVIIGLARALIEGEPLDYRPAALEQLVLEGWQHKRAGGGHITIEREPGGQPEQPIVFDGDVCRPAEDAQPMGALEFGAGPSGGLVRLRVDSDRVEFGPPMAPKTASVWQLADELWGTEIGRLDPAVGVRGVGGGGRLGSIER